jgi:hypothetical protein
VFKTFGRSVGIAVSATALALSLPAAASAGASVTPATSTPVTCSATPATSGAPRIWKAFAAFMDPADYWLAPGGDFETAAAGWSLSGARVVAGNETRGVLPGRNSLALGGGLVSLAAEAVSPPFCVTAEHPTFRFLFKPKGAVGLLNTFIRYRAADGSTQEEQVRSRVATTLLPGIWRPSELQPLATKLPMARIGGVAQVQLVFRSPINAIGAGYQIDDVLVDPYRSR